MAVKEAKNTDNKIIDAIGPETFTYKELIKTISSLIGKNKKVISVSHNFGYFVGKIVSKLVGDVIITREEIDGLSSDLLYTQSPPAGKTKLTDWIKENSKTLGKKYANELKRRKNRAKAYLSN